MSPDRSCPNGARRPRRRHALAPFAGEASRHAAVPAHRRPVRPHAAGQAVAPRRPSVADGAGVAPVASWKPSDARRARAAPTAPPIPSDRGGDPRFAGVARPAAPRGRGGGRGPGAERGEVVRRDLGGGRRHGGALVPGLGPAPRAAGGLRRAGAVLPVLPGRMVAGGPGDLAPAAPRLALARAEDRLPGRGPVRAQPGGPVARWRPRGPAHDRRGPRAALRRGAARLVVRAAEGVRCSPPC